MTFDEIVGHDRLNHMLLSALASGQLGHALLFVGARGVGKQSVAQALARIMLCVDPTAPSSGAACGACVSCRLLVGGGHPDLHYVAPDGTQIKIEQIRALHERLSLRPYYGGAKLAILDDVDQLGMEASAAFLKTLEEPPAATYLILVCHNLAALQQTIVSRCQVYRFGTLSREQIVHVLEGHPQIDEAQRRLLASLSEGRPGRALETDLERLLPLRQLAITCLRLALAGQTYDCLRFIEDLTRGRKREEVLEFVDVLASVTRDLLLSRHANLDDYLIHLDCRDELASLADRLRPLQREAIFEAVLNAAQVIRRNVNAQLTLESFAVAAADVDALAEFNRACRR